MLTLNQAQQHLAGVRKLAVTENQFLSCVHTYLRQVEIDLLAEIRADQFTSHEQIAAFIAISKQTERQVDNFLRGAL